MSNLSLPESAAIINGQPSADRCRAFTERIIEPEPPVDIHVDGGGALIIPREDINLDLDDGAELDLASAMAKKIRRPGRREWIALNRLSEFTTRLLEHKPKVDGMDIEHYYVDASLREPIRDELKNVRVFQYYSFNAKCFGLWIVKVTLENTWYESVALLLKQPAEFFTTNAFRVISDKGNSRYRTKHKPLPGEVAWPPTPTNVLLGEAIGPDHFISSPDHPIYRDLIEGEELEL